MKNILNAVEFADAVRVSMPTAYGILQSGKVRAVKVGKRQWRITKEAVEEYFNGGGAEVASGKEIEGQAAQ